MSAIKDFPKTSLEIFNSDVSYVVRKSAAILDKIQIMAITFTE